MAKAPNETPIEGDPRDPFATGDAARPGSAGMADREGIPPHDIDDTGRTDASGYDVEPPPDVVTRHSHDIGLSDEDAEHEGCREFDSGVEWTGDRPYPGSRETRDDEAADEETPDADADAPVGDDTGEAAPVADLAEAVIALIEDDPAIDVADLSVEVRGATVILRGSAGSEHDRERAGAAAAHVPGVRSVDNELSTG